MGQRFSGPAAQAARTTPVAADRGLALGLLLVSLGVGLMLGWIAHGTTHGILQWLVLMVLCGAGPLWIALRASRPHAVSYRPAWHRRAALAWLAVTGVALLLVWVLPDEPLLPRSWWLTVPAGLLVAAPGTVLAWRDLRGPRTEPAR